MIPPFLIYFSFGKMNFGIWFPLFILWPIGLLLFLLFLPFWILAAVAMVWIPGYRSLLKAPLYVHNLICSFSGLIIEIQDEKVNFSIKLI